MLIKDVIQKTTQFFRDKGFDSPRLDTELLIAEALHWERMKLYLNYDYPLTESELSSCRELVRRRATGEPVAYILGRKDFYNHTFKVNANVLIPRPETEQIVEELTQWGAKESESLRIVDLGTGSGCIGLSALAALPEANLLAVDISSGAIEVAKENAATIGVAERARFLTMDAADLVVAQVQEALGAMADAVVANPPYIAADDPNVSESVRKFEPASALFSPEEGLEHLRKWMNTAVGVLRPGGFVMFEIGETQGRAALEIFESNGNFASVEVVRDLSGRDRFIRGYKSQEN